MTRRLACLAVLALAATGLCAPPASADSLVFIRDTNVWLANGDGSGQYQVTLDGTAGAPYESPSQADDGTIVAVRETPGQRRQIYRMHQNGGLLNPPINTPAPGTGALNARVSPDGLLVAYWFVTTVSDPICPFCVDVASRALISHSERFTAADESGLTPNTGAWPTWMSNDTLLLSQGSANEWFYRLGAPEGEHWFDDGDVFPSPFLNLTDGEASRTGNRLAIVRGNNQETIILYSFVAPPAKPTSSGCGLQGPSGKFVGPTWSNDGQTLAWQEDDGIWTEQIVSVTDCAASPPGTLRIPGGSAPDFGPAAINPGPRPPCGNPGNPTACPPPPCATCPPPCATCPPPCATCSPAPSLAATLRTLLRREAKALRTLRIRGLLRRGRVKITFEAPDAGTLAMTLSTARPSANAAVRKTTVLAGGRHPYMAAGKGTLTVRLSKKGRRLLRHAQKVKTTLTASFTPKGGSVTKAKRAVQLRR